MKLCTLIPHLILLIAVCSWNGLYPCNAFGYNDNYGKNRYLRHERERNKHLDIQRINDRIFVFRDKKPLAPINLKTGETILQMTDRGYMGAVLTSERVLAVSTAGSWFSEKLELGESEKAELIVGDGIVLFISKNRILAANRNIDRFVQMDLSAGDEVIAYKAGQNMGLVVLSDRAIGFAAEASGFREIQFQMGESFQSLEMSATFSLVHTDRAIYVLSASSGTWSKQESEQF